MHFLLLSRTRRDIEQPFSHRTSAPGKERCVVVWGVVRLMASEPTGRNPERSRRISKYKHVPKSINFARAFASDNAQLSAERMLRIHRLETSGLACAILQTIP